MKIRYQKLCEEITKLKCEIETLPEGDFYCSRNGKGYKWYQTLGTSELTNYISKANLDLAEKLTYKKYLTLQLEDCICEKEAIESYFLKYSNEKIELKNFLNHPEYQKLLLPNINNKTKELIEWMKEPYEKCTAKKKHLIHKTLTGEMVRSKSESLIYMYLYMNQIPFRYDAALQLGQVTRYPDFTIHHPKTGEYFYWENNGMMDDPVYIRRTFTKLEEYTMCGIIPGKQLITTYETTENLLNVEEVQEIVERYFL